MSGAVTALQRTSSDLRLNPHLHLVVLDGAWHEQGGELAWEGLGHLKTSEVGDVLERVVRRTLRHLRRRGLLRIDEAEPSGEGDPEGNLAASAVSGQAPPAGPQWLSGLAPLEPHALARATSPAGRSAPADTARGRSCWHAPSPWTCSLVPTARGRMKLLAMVKDPTSIARYLAAVGEPTEVPRRSPGRRRVLRRQALGEEHHGVGHGSGGDETA